MRSKTKMQLRADRAALSRKFPPDVYNKLTEEPAEVLQYARDLARWANFTKCSEKELQSLLWIGGRD